MRLALGLILFTVGTVIIMNSGMGYGPWELFHAGIACHIPLTVGQVGIVTGAVIVMADLLMKEAVGIGTLANMVFIGLLMDWMLPIIPRMEGAVPGFFYMVLGLLILGLGSYFYIQAGFGAGPRDTLMVALRRHTQLPVGVSRFAIEITVALLGWLFGGPIGVGTMITAVGLGSVIQIVFRLFHFEATAVEHENLADTMRKLKNACKKADVNG